MCRGLSSGVPCAAAGGAPRAWGVYWRTVVDSDGVDWRIPVPRFICRGRGPKGGAGKTFSVLPAKVVPRRRWSLPLALKAAELCEVSLRAALGFLSELGIIVEGRYLRRWLAVLGIACERLRQHPLPGVQIETGGRRRDQALELVRVCRDWQTSGSSPPEALVMAWQERYLVPLLAISL